MDFYTVRIRIEGRTYADNTCVTERLCDWLLHDERHTEEWLANPNREIGRVTTTKGFIKSDIQKIIEGIGFYLNTITREWRNMGEWTANCLFLLTECGLSFS